MFIVLLLNIWVGMKSFKSSLWVCNIYLSDMNTRSTTYLNTSHFYVRFFLPWIDSYPKGEQTDFKSRNHLKWWKSRTQFIPPCHKIVTMNEHTKYLWKTRLNLIDQKSHLRKSKLISETDRIKFLIIDQLNSTVEKTIDLTRLFK
jgi:hypothetical protein